MLKLAVNLFLRTGQKLCRHEYSCYLKGFLIAKTLDFLTEFLSVAILCLLCMILNFTDFANVLVLYGFAGYSVNLLCGFVGISAAEL